MRWCAPSWIKEKKRLRLRLNLTGRHRRSMRDCNAFTDGAGLTRSFELAVQHQDKIVNGLKQKAPRQFPKTTMDGLPGAEVDRQHPPTAPKAPNQLFLKGSRRAMGVANFTTPKTFNRHLESGR